MIRILAACGAGVNSSHQIANAIKENLEKRGYNVKCDAMMIKDVNESVLQNYDIFAQIAKSSFSFTPSIPVVDAGPILFRVASLAEPVYQKIEDVIKERNLS